MASKDKNIGRYQLKTISAYFKRSVIGICSGTDTTMFIERGAIGTLPDNPILIAVCDENGRVVPGVEAAVYTGHVFSHNAIVPLDAFNEDGPPARVFRRTTRKRK